MAEIFVPDGKPVAAALKRITHLGIGAHQDDLEFMAFQGILECHASKTKWFGGVTCTNGSGSSRVGKYKKFSDEQMMAVRRREQNKAAKLMVVTKSEHGRHDPHCQHDCLENTRSTQRQKKTATSNHHPTRRDSMIQQVILFIEFE